MFRSITSLKPTRLSFVLLLLAGATGCSDSQDASPATDGGSQADGPITVSDGGTSDVQVATAPSVVSTVPVGAESNVALNTSISVNFSETMDNTTIDATTFTLSTETADAGAMNVPGVVVPSNGKAMFWPAARLETNRTYVAKVSTGIKSLNGIPLAADYTWSFTTGTSVAQEAPVDLGKAGDFAILAKSGISTVPGSTITGNLGVSPAAASYITGFSLSADATNVFSTTPQVTGKVYAADYQSPTPANLTAAVSDMETAFTDAASRAPDATELGAGDIGGRTIGRGVYRWGTGLLIPTDVTLTGSASDVWVFQIAQDVTVASAAKIVMAGGAVPKNVFWQVAGKVELGTTSHFEGIVLAHTAIAMRTGASINGRLLAQTAVSLEGNLVNQPSP